MTSMSALWLPILLSSVAVFIVSSIIHMASPWHKTDYPKLANEDAIMDALRPLVTPGDYMMPRPLSMADMKTPEFMAKAARGPRVVMTVMPNRQNMSMTRELVLWFVYLVVVSCLAAYVAAHALLPNAPRNAVIRYAGLVSFIAYASALWQLSIWYSRSWGITIKATIDLLIYAVVTALIFAYMWPHA